MDPYYADESTVEAVAEVIAAEARVHCDDCTDWQEDAARAVIAAVVEHLGLTVQFDHRRRLLVEHDGHHEYSHACPACNPLPNEQARYVIGRLVSRWTEVEP
jgi:hypothetical protein